jgi:hypothetical protein
MAGVVGLTPGVPFNEDAGQSGSLPNWDRDTSHLTHEIVFEPVLQPLNKR